MTLKKSPPVKETQTSLPIGPYLQKWGFNLHVAVSAYSIAIVVSLITIVLLFTNQAEAGLERLQNFMSDSLGWFFILAANIYLSVVIFFGVSKLGKIRIGGADAKPEFSTFGWYSMLFSAGMGIGIMFWSVAEPISHFEAPPSFNNAVPGSIEAAKTALALTFFHWGFHAWGIYALLGLALSFFTFNLNLPLTPRSLFYPFLKNQIFGWKGNLIDVLALIATLFGLATSLGFGAEQANAGFNFLFNIPNNITVQIILIAIITSFATLSLVSGLDKGIQLLSQLNVYLAAAFMGFILLAGPFKFLIASFIENVGYYVSILPRLSFWTESFSDQKWQADWTIFYWGWWISWSPFVGSFIARISKGRTIREFVFGVLLIPSLITCFWMSVFGGTAIKQTLDGVGSLPEAVKDNVSTALFVMLQNLPFTFIASMIGIMLVISFFVTSSDSGSLVVDQLSSGGQLFSPVPQRIFWAASEGVVACILLWGGGLTALQTVAIMTGFPFAIILLITCFSLHKALVQEYHRYHIE